MNIHQVTEILLHKGKTLLYSPRESNQFAGNDEADALLNDIDNTPHAFVLACVMDKQIKSELAWVIPYLIAKKLGNFKFQTLATLSLYEHEPPHSMSLPDPIVTA